MARILLVEDDENMSRPIAEWLEAERHYLEVVANGKDALELMKIADYDLVVLDVELPEISGLEVCKQYRDHGGAAPILMLTARGELSDKERGFGAGVDDYLVKPFHLKELSARIKALLRRSRDQYLPENLAVGNLILNTAQYQVHKNGSQIAVTQNEFVLLEFFIKHPNRVFSCEALLDKVWPPTTEATPEAVRTCIKALRKKINIEGQLPAIVNVHGVGYMLKTD